MRHRSLLAPRKSFDILALYKSDYYIIIIIIIIIANKSALHIDGDYTEFSYKQCQIVGFLQILWKMLSNLADRQIACLQTERSLTLDFH